MDFHQIFAIIIAFGGITDGIIEYLLAKMSIQRSRIISENEKFNFWKRFKEKLTNKGNFILTVSFSGSVLFALTALPFIVNPSDLIETWIRVGLFGVLGLGIPVAGVLLAIIFKEEIVEIKQTYSYEEPIISLFNYLIFLHVVIYPLLCLIIMIILRKEIRHIKVVTQILLGILFIGILAMWISISVCSYHV
jgi:hypothetical protein